MRLSQPQTDGAEKLLAMINANWMTQAIGAAAELRIADLLAGGPRDAGQLATAASCNPESLRRLLQGLCSLGICTMEADGVFCITALGSMLGSHAHPSVRSWAIYTARVQWEIWGHLVDSVRSGESARKLLTGREGYAHLADDSKVASIFNDAMSELSRIVAANVAHACDFASAGRIVDVGGGHGELLATIVAAHPHLRGVLFDLPHAMAGANAQMVRAGVTFESVAGSFFEAVPRADVHILKSILHNWSDDRCLEILGQCRRSVAPGGRLLIIERVMPDRITSAPPHRAIMRADLNMMVSLGGRERTESEFDDLMAAAEYARERSVAIGLGYNLIEARANRSKP